MKKTTLILATALFAAAAARADLGSVISSFKTSTASPPFISAVYRDANYLYCMVYTGNNYNEWRRYTPAGSLVSSRRVAGYLFYDGEPCHLGGGYVAILEAPAGNYAHLRFINKNTGSTASSFRVEGYAGSHPRGLAWDGRYYYISSYSGRGEFARYTPSGAKAGHWFSDWPSATYESAGIAFAHRARGRAGNYIVVCNIEEDEPCCLLNVNNGSLLATWVLPPRRYDAAVYGDSSRPGQYGAALWLCRAETNGTEWVYEVDLGAAGGQPVEPASIGKVKAIYR